MGFGSNGLDEVRSLRKILTQLRLANLSVNGASSASFASTFGAPMKRSGTGFGAFVVKNFDATLFSEFGR
jgi:hypothetical protein